MVRSVISTILVAKCRHDAMLHACKWRLPLLGSLECFLNCFWSSAYFFDFQHDRMVKGQAALFIPEQVMFQNQID